MTEKLPDTSHTPSISDTPTPVSYTSAQPYLWLDRIPASLANKQLPIALAIIFASVGLIARFALASFLDMPSRASQETQFAIPQESPTPSAEDAAATQPQGSSSATSLGDLLASPVATISAAPSPTIPANPPVMKITYPGESQSVEFSSSSPTLYVTDAVVSGNTTGLKRKVRINGGSWSNYALANGLFSFNPKEGQNTFSIQYQNAQGDESAIYTRNFTYHLVTYVSIGVSGTVYRDENCNGVRDNNEGLVSGSSPVRLMSLPDYSVYRETSMLNGTFGYNGQIKDNVNLTLQISFQSPAGYKHNPKFTAPSFTFSKTAVLAEFSIPQVPNEFVGSCFP